MRNHRLFAISLCSLCAGLLSTAAPAEPAPFKRLYAERASASSYLKSNWNKYDENYHPNYVLDGDPKTAWVEGVDGLGENQVLIIPVSELKSARALRLKIFNGYQKSKSLLDANAAPEKIIVRMRDHAGDEVVAKPFTLSKTMGGQEVTVEVPKGKGFASVEIVVVTAHPGKVYKDTCISDVELSVDSDVAYVAAPEKAKLASLKAWIGGRKAAARQFANVKAEYPFAATHFQMPTEPKWDNDEIALWDEKTNKMVPVAGKAALDVQLKNGKALGPVATLFPPVDIAALKNVEQLATSKGAAVATTWSRVDVKNAPPLPDGIEELQSYTPAWKSIAPFFDPTTVSFFEAKGEAGGVSRSKPRGHDDWVKVWTTSNARVQKRADGTLRTVYFSEHRVIEERETSDTNDHYALDFDVKGQLERVRRIGGDALFMSVSIVDIERNDAGKVKSLRQRSASGGRSSDPFNTGVATQDVVVVANDSNS